VAFIDELRRERIAVELTCAVLREQGCEVTARTYRAWRQPNRPPATRVVTDAQVIDALLAVVYDEKGQLTPEGLYGRRKMTALLRRKGLAVSHHTVDRLMRDLGLNGLRRSRKHRTTTPDPAGQRPTDLLERDFTAPAPNRVWIADFTYVRTWAGFVYVAFVVDVHAQRILAWHAATTKRVELVLTCVRMASWQREHEGHPVVPGELIHHHDAGSQDTALRFTEHLALEGIAPSIGSVGDAYDNSLMETIIGLYRPSASARARSTPTRSRPSTTSSTPLWPGSTGGTTSACTPPSATSHRPSSRGPTTVRASPTNRSRDPHGTGREAGTVHLPT